MGTLKPISIGKVVGKKEGRQRHPPLILTLKPVGANAAELLKAKEVASPQVSARLPITGVWQTHLAQ